MNDMIRFMRQMSSRLSSNLYAGVQPQTTAQQVSFLRNLHKEMRETDSLECPFDDLNIVVFDLETTGFHPSAGDKILSIGAIKMIGSSIKDDEIFYSLIKSETPIPKRIAELTKLDDEMLQTAPEILDVLAEFFRFIGSSILIAHHASHERAFMRKVTSEVLQTKFEHRIIDTSFLIRLSDPGGNSMPLEQICHLNGIDVKQRHHALEDAKLAAKLWSIHLEKAKKLGYKNLREVYEYLSRLT